MAEDKLIFPDHAYRVMAEIAENEKVTQRELSKELGLSVGSVNVLINKLVKEGLIKIEQVSGKQVLYMLTPAGMVEKAKKTASYLKAHYNAIYRTKEKMQAILEELEQQYDAIFIFNSQDEMGEMMKVAVHEYRSHHREAKVYWLDKNGARKMKAYKEVVVVHMGTDEQEVESYKRIRDVAVVSIIERL